MGKKWLSKRDIAYILSIVIGVIIAIIVSFVLKVLFWGIVIYLFLYSFKQMFLIFDNENIKRRLSILLIVLIILIDILGGIFVYNNYKVVHQKIDIIGEKVGGFFGFKNGKVVLDIQGGVENIATDEYIKNLNNKVGD